MHTRDPSKPLVCTHEPSKLRARVDPHRGSETIKANAYTLAYLPLYKSCSDLVLCALKFHWVFSFLFFFLTRRVFIFYF